MSFGFEANVSEPDYLVKAMRQYQCVQGQPCAAGPQGPADRNKLAWTTFVQKRASAALVTAVETPMRAFYPKARLSAYWQKVWDPAHCFTPESEGYMQCRGGPLDGGAAGAVALSIQSPVYCKMLQTFPIREGCLLCLANRAPTFQTLTSSCAPSIAATATRSTNPAAATQARATPMPATPRRGASPGRSSSFKACRHSRSVISTWQSMWSTM